MSAVIDAAALALVRWHLSGAVALIRSCWQALDRVESIKEGKNLNRLAFGSNSHENPETTDTDNRFSRVGRLRMPPLRQPGNPSLENASTPAVQAARFRAVPL
jgi:hypothetical protein